MKWARLIFLAFFINLFTTTSQASILAMPLDQSAEEWAQARKGIAIILVAARTAGMLPELIHFVELNEWLGAIRNQTKAAETREIFQTVAILTLSSILTSPWISVPGVYAAGQLMGGKFRKDIVVAVAVISWGLSLAAEGLSFAHENERLAISGSEGYTSSRVVLWVISGLNVAPVAAVLIFVLYRGMTRCSTWIHDVCSEHYETREQRDAAPSEVRSASVATHNPESVRDPGSLLDLSSSSVQLEGPNGGSVPNPFGHSGLFVESTSGDGFDGFLPPPSSIPHKSGSLDFTSL